MSTEKHENGRTTGQYLFFLRLIFLIVAFAVGYHYRYYLDEFSDEGDRLLMALIFVGIAGIITYLENLCKTKDIPKELIMGVLGFVAGLMLATFVCSTVILDETSVSSRGLRVGLHFIFGYIGAAMGIRYTRHFDFSEARFLVPSEDRLRGCQVLDTSILIDGRILDIVNAGIFRSPIVVPRFVVSELQALADSTDHRKRSKGRRGFDVLSQLQGDKSRNVEVFEVDFNDLDSVDKKLLAFCKQHSANLCTLDYNLARMAEIEEVEVVNFNRLAQAMKQVIFSGDEVEIEILREGKEEHQGVGYLEDGTMVVVDRGRSHIGQRVPVVVTTVLQTSAGHMVFARINNAAMSNHQGGRTA